MRGAAANRTHNIRWRATHEPSKTRPLLTAGEKGESPMNVPVSVLCMNVRSGVPVLPLPAPLQEEEEAEYVSKSRAPPTRAAPRGRGGTSASAPPLASAYCGYMSTSTGGGTSLALILLHI